MSRIVAVDNHTLSVVHVFAGENVVTGGEDGQGWVASFADQNAANDFVRDRKWDDGEILGVSRA